ncbi:MAG: hypothetical protein ACYTBX_08070 [Planctomycetota bacterium]
MVRLCLCGDDFDAAFWDGDKESGAVGFVDYSVVQDDHDAGVGFAANQPAGETCHEIVEFVDFFPTLAGLCGLTGTPEDLEGVSFRMLLAVSGISGGESGRRACVLKGSLVL